MSLLISDAHAQAAGAAASQPAMGLNMLFIAGMFVLMYFMLIRPQQKRAKEHQNMLSKLGAGDEVIISGGILARVIEVGDSFVTVEIADGVRIKVQKSQVSQLVPKGTYKSV